MIQTVRALFTTVDANGAGMTSLIPGAVFQTVGVFVGAKTAVVTIQGSLDNTTWSSLGTINLSDTTTTGFFVTPTAPWTFYRATVSAIAGLGTVTSITVNMGADI